MFPNEPPVKDKKLALPYFGIGAETQNFYDGSFV
jgi:hypothetical protein